MTRTRVRVLRTLMIGCYMIDGALVLERHWGWALLAGLISAGVGASFEIGVAERG